MSIPQHVVFRHFAAESVMLNLKTGQYHGLNPVAGRMLEVLVETATVDDAAHAVAAEYEVDAEVVRRDLAQLLEGLTERGLVEVAGS